jgi:hypothetical protein
MDLLLRRQGRNIVMVKNYAGGSTLTKGGKLSSNDPAQDRSFAARKSAHEETIRTKEVFNLLLDQLIKTGRVDEVPSNISAQLKAQLKKYNSPAGWLRSRHEFMVKAIPKIAKEILHGDGDTAEIADHILTDLQKIELRKDLENRIRQLKHSNENDANRLETIKNKIAERKTIIGKFEKRFPPKSHSI